MRLFLVLCIKYLGIFLLNIVVSMPIVYGQACISDGVVVDASFRNPIEFASIISLDSLENIIAYTYTDANGYFSLEFSKEQCEQIVQFEIALLGFESQVIGATELSRSDSIFLSPLSIEIEEIVFTEKIPAIIQREDTTMYRVDQFTTGNERKLAEILELLPGIQVGSDYNIYFKGELVQELTIEGRKFFSGDPTFGVKNIPADVIKDIVILEKANDLPFLKQEGIETKIQLNVLLHNSDSKFFFGELSAGVGLEGRYDIDPSVFHYSPKAITSVLTNWSTVTAPPITFKEFLGILGGGFNFESTEIMNIPRNDNQLLQLTLPRSNAEQYYEMQAGNTVFGINGHNMSITGVRYRPNFESAIDRNDIFFLGNGRVFDQRSISNRNDDLDTDLITLAYNSNQTSDFVIDLSGKWNRHTSRLAELDQRISDVRRFDLFRILDSKNESYEYRGKLSWTINEKSLFRFQLFHNHSTSRQSDELASSKFDFFNIQSNLMNRNELIANDEEVRSYWNYRAIYNYVLSNSSKLKFSITGNELKTNISTRDIEQNSDDQNPVSLSNFGFDNDTNLEQGDITLGGNYRFGLNAFNFDAGLFGSSVNRVVSRIDQTDALFPLLDMSYRVKNIGEISAKYSARWFLPEVEDYNLRLSIIEPNKLWKGNSNSLIGKVQNWSIGFKRSRLLKNSTININLSHVRIQKNYLLSFASEGDLLINSLALGNGNESRFVVSAFVAKNIWKLKLFARGSVVVSEEPAIFNGDLSNVKSILFQPSIELKDGTRSPNFTLRYFLNRNNRKIEDQSDVSEIHTISLNVNKELLPSVFMDVDLQYDIINAFGTNSLQSNLDTGLRYKSIKYPWEIYLKGTNLFNIRNYVSTQVNEFYLQQQSQRITPRVVVIGFRYDL